VRGRGLDTREELDRQEANVLYAAVAVRSFRRYSTYTAATLAGIFTNSVFGLIYSYAYIELWRAAPHVGGYTTTDAVTYVWLGQSMIMTVAMWSGGTTDDLNERIRTGDVSIDLYRPVPVLWWYYAGDLGRATYHFLTRGLAPSLIGLVLFHIRGPASPAAAVGFAVSIYLAVTVSFAIRFLVATTAFWVLDSSGIRLMSAILSMALSGMVLPLNLVPGIAGTIVNALPWASYVQVPIDVYLGRHHGTDLLAALGFQAMWAVVLLALCAWVLERATVKVVVQGG
jgi:ABC-2 type transport system permease protein